MHVAIVVACSPWLKASDSLPFAPSATLTSMPTLVMTDSLFYRPEASSYCMLVNRVCKYAGVNRDGGEESCFVTFVPHMA